MKSLIVAIAVGALSFLALPQPASAGGGFEVCLNGVGCFGKSGRENRRHRWGREHRRSWGDYCYYNPQDYRCDPYRYRQPPPRNCFYSPDYGWECY